MHLLRKLFNHVGTRNLRKLIRQPLENRRCLCIKEVPPAIKPLSLIPKGVMGQPTCHTHPHLIPEDQLTCGVVQAEYSDRRATLVNKLVSSGDNIHKSHVIVIPGACKQYMSDKIPYVFRQNSDFFYLTGCLEPSAILAIIKPAQVNNFKSILFVHDKDDHAELWEGPRTGCAEAAKLFLMDETRPIDTFNSFLSQIANNTSQSTVLWYHSDSTINANVHNIVQQTLGRDRYLGLGDPKLSLHEMRVVKSPAEIELMKETCYIGSQSMNMAMACTHPGISEHMVNAVLEYSCKQGGAEHLAFPPVVAGGTRATHIHYVNNNQLLRDNEMVLVDSGCQRWLYNSDISRTWPVSGKFNKHHKILYELVLTVQKRLIELLGEHRPPLDHLFDSMCRLLGKHLQQEGILPKSIEGHELAEKAYRLCPHHVSHYLGMDVHDSPLIKRNIPVCTNMVVTVEPGIYIRPDDTSVPAEFRGVGIRIEDDVLITDTGVLNMTSSCVKEVADIEAIVGKHGP